MGTHQAWVSAELHSLERMFCHLWTSAPAVWMLQGKGGRGMNEVELVARRTHEALHAGP